MQNNNTDTMNCAPTANENENVNVAIGKIEADTQVTLADTGWSEEDKDRMRQRGYDSLDMVRAWYS